MLDARIHSDRRILTCALIILLALRAPSATASSEPKPNSGPAPFEALSFRSIGPAAGGRVSRVAGVPGNPLVYYAATAAGGVWKTTNGGSVWNPVFDEQAMASVGAIAVAPSNPNIVYVGAGEANIRGNVAPGDGIYRSLDAGQTWTHVWKQEGQIGTIVVDPRNADIAFAAVLGHAFGPNPERGVYRTRDGGRTWVQVLKKDADTGASDVAIDPSNANIVYAGLWQARRRPWELVSGGPGSGLYVSRDGGDTWKQLTEDDGLPKGIWGKVGVAVAPSDGRRVYALIEAEEGGLFRSDDGGKKWQRISEHHALRQRPWYYSTMTIDPSNPDVVWFPQVPMLRTKDGGRTIEQPQSDDSKTGIHHGDHHDLWIDPLDPQHMIGANDGGVDISVDGGETWMSPPLPISQFYHVSTDDAVPYHVMGAMQDIGTGWGPSNSLTTAGIQRYDWHDVGGGEAGFVVAMPGNPDVIYGGEYSGYLSRYDFRTGQRRNISIYPENFSGHGGEDAKYRFQWTAPIATSPHDPSVIYHASNVLFRSNDSGQTWTAISGDLTRNDKSKQRWSGGPITGDNTGVEIYDTIFAVVESPRERGLIWAGSDDGLVHVTRDGGGTWTDVTPRLRGLPQWATIACIEPSPHDAATAYVVADAHRLDDMHPYLWKTTDYGASWRALAGALPQDVYLHAVREDPKRKGMLYAGTERGVSYSTDDGASWKALKLGLPTVAVHDLVVKNDDLVVATHGRSLWIFDDLTAIREWSPDIAEQHAHLFAPPPAIRWRYDYAQKMAGGADNPPKGAVVYYYLKDKPKGEITLDVLDAHGGVIRTLRSTAEPADAPPGDPDGWSEAPEPDLAVDPGVQRAVWNFGYEHAKKIKDAKVDSGNPKDRVLALPGAYTLRLNVDGVSQTAPLVVQPDPRVQLDAQALQAQLDLALQVRDALDRVVTLVEKIQSVRTQVKTRSAVWEQRPQAGELTKAAQAVVEKCDALEAKIQNPKAQVVYDILAQKGGAQLYSRMAPIYSELASGDGEPTQGLRTTFEAQLGELAAHEAAFQSFVDGDLRSLNAQAAALDLEAVLVP